MEDGRIPKDLLYGQLAPGCRPVGRPALRYKDVCKRDLKLTDINPDSWEKLADDRDGWRHAVRDGVSRGKVKKNLQLEDKRSKRKERQQTVDSNQPSTPGVALNRKTDPILRTPLSPETEGCLLLLLSLFIIYFNINTSAAGQKEKCLHFRPDVSIYDTISDQRVTLKYTAQMSKNPSPHFPNPPFTH